MGKKRHAAIKDQIYEVMGPTPWTYGDRYSKGLEGHYVQRLLMNPDSAPRVRHQTGLIQEEVGVLMWDWLNATDDATPEGPRTEFGKYERGQRLITVSQLAAVIAVYRDHGARFAIAELVQLPDAVGSDTAEV